jgi:NhaA family Na+:H+ antiporter
VEPTEVSRHPPGASAAARLTAWQLVRPIERFFHVEAASGVVLWFATFVALAWANWPGSTSYDALWSLPLGIQVGGWSFVRPLQFWVNDGLMTLFFFVVGLEIRHEIHTGELSNARRAALPVAAAFGGMVVPALVYTALNLHRETAAGWGVPLATDIAFAAGVITLLGSRVPAQTRVSLLALAVIDDIGAIVVITLGYSGHLSARGLGVVVVAAVVLAALRKLGVRHILAYAVPALAMWAGLHASGLHPTLAGVVLGMLTPVRAWYGRRGVVDTAREIAAAIEEDDDPAILLGHLERLKRARREAVPPAVKLHADLHAWVAFGVMPMFALANAGIPLHGLREAATRWTFAFAGIVLGLVVGKPVGILLATWVATRLRIAELPSAGWRGVVVMGLAGGIGFTMSIFMAGLAFEEGSQLRAAKAAVLTASLIAGVLAFAAGRVLLPRDGPQGAPTERDRPGRPETADPGGPRGSGTALARPPAGGNSSAS